MAKENISVFAASFEHIPKQHCPFEPISRALVGNEHVFDGLGVVSITENSLLRFGLFSKLEEYFRCGEEEERNSKRGCS